MLPSELFLIQSNSQLSVRYNSQLADVEQKELFEMILYATIFIYSYLHISLSMNLRTESSEVRRLTSLSSMLA